MPTLRMQPTFRVDVAKHPDEVMRGIKQALQTPDCQGFAMSAGRCADFKIEQSKQRFWSPHLSIQVSQDGEGTLLFGRFSPRPEIWTMCMAIYFVAACCMCGALIWAYVQWFMGNPPWSLIVLPIGASIIAALHVASLIGQTLSSDQMHLLRERFDRVAAASFQASSAALVKQDNDQPKSIEVEHA